MILYRDGTLTSFHDLETDWQASFDAATQNFIDSILGKAEPTLSFAEGYEIQRMTVAVKKSGDEGRIVTLNEIN